MQVFISMMGSLFLLGGAVAGLWGNPYRQPYHPFVGQGRHFQIQLDSVVTTGQAKREYTYDSAGNTVMSTYYYRENDTWLARVAYEYSYGDDTLLQSRIRYGWESGKRTAENKTDYTYRDGRRISMILYDWNGEWVSSRSYRYSYDEAGNRSAQTQFSWVDSRWEETRHTTYSYDDAGRMVLQMRYSTEDTGRRENFRTEYTYNEADRIISRTGFSRQDEMWHPERRTINEYESDSILIAGSRYSFEGGEWLKEQRDTFAYDVHGTATEHIRYTAQGDVWKHTEKIITTVDDSRFLDSAAFGYYFKAVHIPVLTEYYEWDTAGGEWEPMPESVQIFYYSDFEPVSQSMDKWAGRGRNLRIVQRGPALTIFTSKPVPVQAFVYTPSGRCVTQRVFTTPFSLDLSSRSSGIYLLRIQSGPQVLFNGSVVIP
ncbi:MAG: hypothetical protein ACQEQ4_05520 [Fibrobacterota bacterium]